MCHLKVQTRSFDDDFDTDPEDDTPDMTQSVVKKSTPKRGASKKPVEEDDDSDDFEDPDLMDVPGAKIQAKSLANIRGGPSGSMPNFGMEYFAFDIQGVYAKSTHFHNADL